MSHGKPYTRTNRLEMGDGVGGAHCGGGVTAPTAVQVSVICESDQLGVGQT